MPIKGIMKLRTVLSIALMAFVPLCVGAQGKGKGKVKHAKHGKHYKPGKTHGHKGNKNVRYGRRIKNGPPPWAPAHGYRAKQHVYFPDYYTFYDPYRNGYVYWNNSNWAFSPSVPGFLTNVNLGGARIQLMSDVPLATHPETYYSTYSRQYPARSVNISVPVPVIR